MKRVARPVAVALASLAVLSWASSGAYPRKPEFLPWRSANVAGPFLPNGPLYDSPFHQTSSRPSSLAAAAAQRDDQSSLPAIRIELDSRAAHYRERIAAAAEQSLARYTEWLGPLGLKDLTISAAPWRSRPESSPGHVVVRLPWQSARPLMDVEAAVAYGVAQQYWLGRLVDAKAGSIGDGLAWYLQSRVVERLFNLEFALSEHSAEGVRFFGGGVPWVFPSLRLSRWTAGLGRDAFLRRVTESRGWPTPGYRLPDPVSADVGRGALAVGSLERHLGWPVLQGALRVLADEARNRVLSATEVEEIISASAGRNLSWFFESAFDPWRRFDFAIDRLGSGPAAESCSNGRPCYRTSVVVSRRGSARFTGTSRQPQGEYETGDALELRVWFEDGQAATARWDGGAATRTFEFESSVPATSARLDPDGALLLDVNPLDHVRMTSPHTNVPVAKWVARWIVWLQDAMLCYTGVI